MNSLHIIGNLTRDPELRTTPSGKNVCSFDVAVGRRKKVEGQPEADYFKVTIWEDRADLCAKYLQKGKKVCVIGSVSVTTYTATDGTTKAAMEIKDVNEIEFLSPKYEDPQKADQKIDKATGFQDVTASMNLEDGLPF